MKTSNIITSFLLPLGLASLCEGQNCENLEQLNDGDTLIIDTDLGYDDMNAMTILAGHNFCPQLITTTHGIAPSHVAPGYARALMKAIGCQGVKVVAGATEGIDAKKKSVDDLINEIPSATWYENYSDNGTGLPLPYYTDPATSLADYLARIEVPLETSVTLEHADTDGTSKIAADSIIEVARNSTDCSIVLLAIGSLTNVAEAYKKEEDRYLLNSKIKRIQIMGGAITNTKQAPVSYCGPQFDNRYKFRVPIDQYKPNGVECNVWFDPTSFIDVIKKGKNVVIGQLNATDIFDSLTEVHETLDSFKLKVEGGLLFQPFSPARVIKRIAQGYWVAPSYDGVAAAQLINPKIFDTDMKTIAVYENGSMLPIEEADNTYPFDKVDVRVATGLKLDEYKTILEDVCEKDRTCKHCRKKQNDNDKFYFKAGNRPRRCGWLNKTNRDPRLVAYICSENAVNPNKPTMGPAKDVCFTSCNTCSSESSSLPSSLPW